jgi:hypothetical protein
MRCATHPEVETNISVVVSFAIYYLFVPWFSFYTIIGLALGILVAVTRLR